MHPFAPKFSAEDLPYNQHGELSPRQKAEMASDSRGCLVRLLIVDGLAVAYILGALALGAKVFDQWAGIGFVVLIMTVPFLIIALLPTPKSLFDIKKVEGAAQVSMGYVKGNNKYYMLVVKGLDFRVSPGLYGALKDGDGVTVYYTTSGARNSLVSWERT